MCHYLCSFYDFVSIINYVYVCVCVCVCIHVYEHCAHRDQKAVLHPLEPELQGIVSHLACVLESEHGSTV